LDAITSADARATPAWRRAPRRNVAHTNTTPKSGHTRNIVGRPPAARNSAMTIDSPDGQMGTLAPGTVFDGTWPAGANESAASGQAACRASRSGSSRRADAHRSAWRT
jgi:hypothetical protein